LSGLIKTGSGNEPRTDNRRYRTMSNNLASRQPFRVFSQARCGVESEFTVAETIDGVYTVCLI
jgi:hypothetical protein